MLKLLNSSKFQLIILVLVTLLAYSNIFQNNFLIDDNVFIRDWQQIKSLGNIPALISGDVPVIHQGVYRPLRSVLYTIYYSIWQENKIGWHAHSILVHLLSTILVYLIVKRLALHTKDEGTNFIPFTASLLFGLHPIHTESITYIAASMEMTGVVFFFASFYFYLKKRLYLSLIFAGLAFFTYEMTLTLPLLFILYELTLGESKFLSLKFQKVYAYFILAGVFIFIRVVLLQIISRGDYLAYSFYHTQLTMTQVYVKYLQLLVLPFNISYLHELAPGFDSWMTKYNNLQSILNQSFFDAGILLSLATLIGLIGLAIYSYKKSPLITFCIGWFFASLLPVSYILPQGIALAEKYMYIPSFGFVLLIAYIIFNFQSSIFKSYLQFGIWCLVILICLFFGYLTFQRNKDWKDEISFWGKAAIQRPNNPLPFYNLALAYGDKNNLTQTKQYYLKTIEIEPNFWEARFNLANLYVREGKFSEALEQYILVSRLNPEFTPALDRIKQLQSRQ